MNNHFHFLIPVESFSDLRSVASVNCDLSVFQDQLLHSCCIRIYPWSAGPSAAATASTATTAATSATAVTATAATTTSTTTTTTTIHLCQLSVNFDGETCFAHLNWITLQFLCRTKFQKPLPLYINWSSEQHLTDWLLSCTFCVTPTTSAISYKNITCLINTELLVGESLLLNMLWACKSNEVMSHYFTYSTPLKK